MQKLKSFLVFSIFCFSLIFISCEQPNQNSGENQIDDEEEVSFEGFDILSSYQIDDYKNICISSKEDLIIEFNLEDIDTTDYSFEYDNKNKFLSDIYITLDKAQNNSKKVVMTVQREILKSLDADYNVGFGYIEKNAIEGKLIVKNNASEIIKEIEINNVKVNSWPDDLIDIQYSDINSLIRFKGKKINGINDIHNLSIVYRNNFTEDYFFTDNYVFAEQNKITTNHSNNIEREGHYVTIYFKLWDKTNTNYAPSIIKPGYIDIYVFKSFTMDRAEDPLVKEIYLTDDYGLVSNKIYFTEDEEKNSKIYSDVYYYENPHIFLIDSKGKKYELNSDELVEVEEKTLYLATDLFNNDTVDYFDYSDTKKTKKIDSEFVEYNINGISGHITKNNLYFDSYSDKQPVSANFIYNIKAYISQDLNSYSTMNELELTKVKVAKPFYIKADADSSIADGSFEKPIKYFHEIENVIKAEDGGKYINNTVYLFKVCGVFEEETLEFKTNYYEFYNEYDYYAPTCIYITANDSSTLVKKLTTTAMNSKLIFRDININHIYKGFHTSFDLEGEINTIVSYSTSVNDSIYEIRDEDNQYYVAYNTEPVAEIGLKNYTGEIRIMVHKNIEDDKTYNLFTFYNDVIVPGHWEDDWSGGEDSHSNELIIRYKDNLEKYFKVILDYSRVITYKPELIRYLYYIYTLKDNGQLYEYDPGK